jgi:hypothetical protein
MTDIQSMTNMRRTVNMADMAATAAMPDMK